MQEKLLLRLRRQRTSVHALAGAILLACGCAGTLADPSEFEDGGGASSGSGNSGTSGTASGTSGTTSGTAGMSGTASGTAGMSGTSGTAASNCPDTPTFLATTCATGPTCHITGGSFVDLQSPGVAARLVGMKSVFIPTDLYIDPTTPANSLVLLVLTAATAPPAIGQMPFGGPYLMPAQVSCIQAWVDQVAAAGPGDGGRDLTTGFVDRCSSRRTRAIDGGSAEARECRVS